jgi:hypothetical protein
MNEIKDYESNYFDDPDFVMDWVTTPINPKREVLEGITEYSFDGEQVYLKIKERVFG